MDHSAILLKNHANNGNSWNCDRTSGKKGISRSGGGGALTLLQTLHWIGKKSSGESLSITAAIKNTQSFSTYAENKGRESCAKSHF